MNLIFILITLSTLTENDFEVPETIIYDSTTVQGVFLGYSVGDYIHPVIQTKGGKILAFWSTDPLMDYFLTRHVGEVVILEIENQESYIPEAGGKTLIPSVVGVTIGSTSFSIWRDSVETLGEPQDLFGDYFAAPYSCLTEEW